MSELACPTCGETERLSGRRPWADSGKSADIVIACDACGTTWPRGARRCRGCGAHEHTTARQRMTTYPRGNQLAVIGMRDVPLCPRCDAHAVSQLGPDRLLADGYRSRFVSGPDDEPAAPTGAASPPAAPPPAPPSPAAPPLAVASPAAPQPRPRRPAVTDPTVRHAVDAYMRHADGVVNATVMLVLGRTLGPTTRLGGLTAAAAGPALARALDEQWARQPDVREQAVRTIGDAVGFWAEQGWLTEEQARRLSSVSTSG